MEIIIGKTAGFCYGVEKAVEGAKLELNKANKKIYCLGEIVHNKEVVKDLQNRGIKFIEKPDEIPENTCKVIIRAHGIPKQTYEECAKRNIEITDFTCPNVLKIHDIAEKYKEKGYYIILVGAKNHPENIGTISFCGKNMSVIEQVEDTYKAIEELKNSKKENCLVIAQTTYHLGKFKKIEEILKKEFEDKINLEIKNTICMATELRQKETEKIAKEVNKMIIIGGKNSSNTKKLYEIASQNCKEAISIETKEDLTKQDILGYAKIGIMAGASTPKESIEDVVKMIEESDTYEEKEEKKQ